MIIPIYLAVEDDLSEFVLRRILSSMPFFQISAVFGHCGYGYLKKKTPAFNQLANISPLLLLTDLDNDECPPSLIQDWFDGKVRHPRFLFRVAVPEVESWILADYKGLQSFLGLRGPIGILNLEQLADAKMKLFGLAAKSKIRDIRDSIVYRDKNGQLHQGPDYNGTLGRFVLDNWDMSVAADRCPSLSGLINALNQLKQDWSQKKS